MKEDEIIYRALGQLQSQTGISVNRIAPSKARKNQQKEVDLVLSLKLGRETLQFSAQVKNELRQLHLPALLEQMEKDKERWILISQYIPKPLKEELKSRGINYLEASGNCFIRQGKLYLYINDQAVTPTRLPEQGKLWKATGLKFLLTILMDDRTINASYRQLAKASGVALGSIGPFIEELKKEGYVGTDRKGDLYIEQKPQLQKKWSELYPSVLRPKLKLGTFRFVDRNKEWETISTTRFLWGAEAAGALLTDHLRPEKLTIYTSSPKIKLIKELRLVPDENGPVELIEEFWEESELDHPGKKIRTVPPLVAYAELIASLDSRNRETAERIAKRYLEK